VGAGPFGDTRMSRGTSPEGQIMGIVSWILLGLIAGLLARFLMPGRAPAGIILTILLGIGGALLGGFLGNHLLGSGDVSGFDLRSLAIAVAGAVLLLFLFGLLKKWGVTG
jgi:uncharacterized membrane protein YeaQ/YmgE (transglycosylase-associated protein family)